MFWVCWSMPLTVWSWKQGDRSSRPAWVIELSHVLDKQLQVCLLSMQKAPGSFSSCTHMKGAMEAWPKMLTLLSPLFIWRRHCPANPNLKHAHLSPLFLWSTWLGFCSHFLTDDTLFITFLFNTPSFDAFTCFLITPFHTHFSSFLYPPKTGIQPCVLFSGAIRTTDHLWVREKCRYGLLLHLRLSLRSTDVSVSLNHSVCLCT